MFSSLTSRYLIDDAVRVTGAGAEADAEAGAVAVFAATDCPFATISVTKEEIEACLRERLSWKVHKLRTHLLQ